jgi:hypothetical protein
MNLMGGVQTWNGFLRFGPGLCAKFGTFTVDIVGVVTSVLPMNKLAIVFPILVRVMWVHLDDLTKPL